MKQTVAVLLVAAVLIIAGCASTDGTEKGTGGEPAAAAAADTNATVKDGTSSTAEKMPVIKTVAVPYTVRETKYFSDGFIESYRVISYDSEMNPVREDLFDSFDAVIESIVTEKKGLMLVQSRLNSRGDLLSRKEITLNGDGLPVKVDYFSNADVLQTSSEYSYDTAGKKTVWKVVDDMDIVLSETEYIYENGLNTRININNAAGKLREYFILEYQKGLPVSKKHYGSDDRLLDAYIYEYADGVLVKEKETRANGSVAAVISYTNDEKGNPVKTEIFDGNGKLKEWSETVYEYVSKEIKVWE